MTDEELIFAYPRAEALSDGQQVDVSEIAREAGIRFPVFFTRAVFDTYVVVPEGVIGQDESGRLWDILWMLKCAIAGASAGLDRMAFSVYVRNNNRAPRPRKLHAQCGPLDIDDPQPAITVMLPDED